MKRSYPRCITGGLLGFKYKIVLNKNTHEVPGTTCNNIYVCNLNFFGPPAFSFHPDETSESRCFFWYFLFPILLRIVCMMTGNTLEKGVRPLINNRGLVLMLVKYLLKVAKDERFMDGKVKNLSRFLRKLFEENGVPFELSCMKAIFPDETDTALSVLGMRDVCALGKSSGPLQHFRETIFPMIIAGKWDFQLNPDKEEAILKVLELKNDNGKIIDLKTNEQLKNRNEKLKERNDDPEFKAREQTTEYKAKRKKYRDDPENKEKAKKYRDDPENKAKRRAREQTTEYKAKAKKYRDDPENKEKARARKEERKRFFVKKQRQITPPYGSNGGCCTMCARKRSIGWMSVVEFCFQIEEDFDNEGLFERQRAEQTCRFLNRIKKKAAKDGEYSKIRSKDVLCLRCLKYKRSATKKIKKILKA